MYKIYCNNGLYATTDDMDMAFILKNDAIDCGYSDVEIIVETDW